MKRTVALGACSAAVLFGAYLTLKAAFAIPQSPQSSIAPHDYEPMASVGDDPRTGCVKARIGNGVEDEFKRRAFLVDPDGNIEVAVQYQVKLPDLYGPGSEMYRIVVQTVRRPDCCDGEWDIDFEMPFEPFAVLAGDHINRVIPVKIPCPTLALQEGAVRVLIEEMQENGEWESRSIQTVSVRPL